MVLQEVLTNCCWVGRSSRRCFPTVAGKGGPPGWGGRWSCLTVGGLGDEDGPPGGEDGPPGGAVRLLVGWEMKLVLQEVNMVLQEVLSDSWLGRR